MEDSTMEDSTMEDATMEDATMEDATMEDATIHTKWYDKTWLVIGTCILFFPVGLYALWKNSLISKGWKISVTIAIALIVIFQPFKFIKENTSPNITIVSHDEILHTDYFDIKLNRVTISNIVNTGDEFADLQPQPGYVYAILNVSYKNIDTESRMISSPSILIPYNGKVYNFDNAEIVMLDGWGLFLDQINPLSSKTTNLVYKLPSGLRGKVFFAPNSSDSEHLIYLSTL